MQFLPLNHSLQPESNQPFSPFPTEVPNPPPFHHTLFAAKTKTDSSYHETRKRGYVAVGGGSFSAAVEAWVLLTNGKSTTSTFLM